MRLWQKFATVVVGLLMIAIFARLSYVVSNGILIEPYAFRGVDVLTPKVRAGQPVRVIYDLDRRRVCTTTIAQFWVDAETGTVIHRDRVPGGYSPLGAHRTLVVLTPPASLPLGRYIYRSVMESDCGLTGYAVQTPDVPFEIMP